MLIFNNYFFSKNNFFFYKECNIFLFYTSLGIIKIKKNRLINLFIRKNFYHLYNLYFFKFQLFNNLIKWINFGYFNKLRIVGIGYRRFYDNNAIVYKLRYNHLIYKVIPFDIVTFKTRKRRKFIPFFSFNEPVNNKIFHIFLLYRISNVYTKKGFFKMNKRVNFKKVI